MVISQSSNVNTYSTDTIDPWVRFATAAPDSNVEHDDDGIKEGVEVGKDIVGEDPSVDVEAHNGIHDHEDEHQQDDRDERRGRRN